MAAGLLLVRGPVDQIQSLAAREQDIKWINDYTKTSKTSQNVFCGSYWVHGVERYTVRDVVDHKESPLVVPVLSRRNGFNLEKYWDQHAINIGMEINKRNYISNRQFWCAVWLPGYVKLTASIHNDGDHSHHSFTATNLQKTRKISWNLMKARPKGHENHQNHFNIFQLRICKAPIFGTRIMDPVAIGGRPWQQQDKSRPDVQAAECTSSRMSGTYCSC